MRPRGVRAGGVTTETDPSAFGLTRPPYGSATAPQVDIDIHGTCGDQPAHYATRAGGPYFYSPGDVMQSKTGFQGAYNDGAKVPFVVEWRFDA